MVAEFSETDEVPEADALRGSLLPLVEAIFAATHGDPRTRAAAMGELMSAVDRIRAALRSKPSFH
jgi:hypothetical protein